MIKIVYSTVVDVCVVRVCACESWGGGQVDGEGNGWSAHVFLTAVFLWMLSLFLPRCYLEWIVEAVALRTAASDKHCVNNMRVTWGLSVRVC